MTPLEADRFVQHVVGLIQLHEKVTDNTSISDLHVTDDRGGSGNWIITLVSSQRIYRHRVAPGDISVERLPHPSKENKDA